MLDIDHFKGINDSAGHSAGDAVLTEVAARLRRAFGTCGVIGRWGGEEFLAAIVAPSPTEATEVGERMRAAVAGAPMLVDGRSSLLVTVSVGVAMSPTATLDELVADADSALYMAKDLGRNRVVLVSASSALT